MVVRVYEPRDRDEVVALWSDVFGYPTAHNDPSLALAKKLAFQPELLIVGEEESKVVGTVMGGYDGHRGWIYSLAVLPSFRGRGIGAMLVADVEKRLSDLGCLKINLQVLETNKEVIEFYKKVGYRAEERISMGKLLGS